MLPRSLPVLLLACLAPALRAQVLDGYVDEPWLSGLDTPVGVAADAVGRVYAWERRGRVFRVEDGELLQPPVLDLSDEVGGWRDFGLLGLALDPHFEANGRIYLYYVVDRHHLLFAGTPDYDPAADWYFEATIGRITRYELDPAADFNAALPGSRAVLLGATPDDGVPILYESHGTGALVFGSDGTLLASSGDGANYGPVDAGYSSGTYWQTALADGILRPAENVGAFRSQLLDSLSGKLLRIDPETGAGVPSNPWYEADDPYSKRSRVWALGLRNPFRFERRPGTGSSDPLAGDPGVLTVGDVGWSRVEELSLVDQAGANLGWPLFEGLTPQPDYKLVETENQDAPNPLFGQGGCDRPYFTFQELIRQDRASHTASFPNPCDPDQQVPASIPTFVHTRPILDWKHTDVVARVPTYEADGSASFARLGDADCPVAGEPFGGFCAIGGGWLEGTGFGPYSGSLVLMDFSSWMRMLRFDDQDRLLEVATFGNVLSPVHARQDPLGDGLVYTSLHAGEVRRVRFAGGIDQPPIAVLAAPTAPLDTPTVVEFDASTSTDPEGGPLEFEWDLGDGSTSTEPSPWHRYTSPDGEPAVARVTLTVRDGAGGEERTSRLVHFDNSPPRIELLEPAAGATYTTGQPTTLRLEALVTDDEHGPEDLTYRWQVFLAHEGHEHPEPPIFTPTAEVQLSPTPCSGGFFYAYRVELEVRDGQGLAGRAARWVLPDCGVGVVPTVVAPAPGAELVPGQPLSVLVDVPGAVERVELRVDGTPLVTWLAPPFEVEWTPTGPGAHTLMALASLPGGESSSSIGHEVLVRQPERLVLALADGRSDAREDADGVVDVLAPELALGGEGLVGLRFPLDLPAGATLVSAHLAFSAAGADTGPARLTIAAEAADDAAPIGGGLHDLSSRPRTAAEATWDVPAWPHAGATGEHQRSPDLTAVLREVIERPGHAPGQAVLLLLEGEGTRPVESQQGRGPRAPRLVLEFLR